MRWRLKTETSEQPIEVELLRADADTYVFTVDGKEVSLSKPVSFPFALKTSEISLTCEAWSSSKWRAVNGSKTYTVEPIQIGASQSGSQNEIRTQMPGRVLKVLVKPGDAIAPQQALMIIEAMKMENEIRATTAAKVKDIPVSAGQSVESGALLLELSPSDS